MGEVTVGNTNMVDPVEWEKLMQEGEGVKANTKSLKSLERDYPAFSGCVSRRQGRQSKAQRQAGGRFPAEKMCEFSSVGVVCVLFCVPFSL